MKIPHNEFDANSISMYSRLMQVDRKEVLEITDEQFLEMPAVDRWNTIRFFDNMGDTQGGRTVSEANAKGEPYRDVAYRLRALLDEERKSA